MPVLLGGTAPGDIHFDGSPITAVWCGTELVWPVPGTPTVYDFSADNEGFLTRDVTIGPVNDPADSLLDTSWPAISTYGPVAADSATVNGLFGRDTTAGTPTGFTGPSALFGGLPYLYQEMTGLGVATSFGYRIRTYCLAPGTYDATYRLDVSWRRNAYTDAAAENNIGGAPFSPINQLYYLPSGASETTGWVQAFSVTGTTGAAEWVAHSASIIRAGPGVRLLFTNVTDRGVWPARQDHAFCNVSVTEYTA